MALENRIREVPYSSSEGTVASIATERRPNVSGTSIVCGSVVTLATLLCLTLLGSAIGLSSFSFEAGNVDTRAVTIGAGIYAGLSMIISYFLGGYVSSRLAGPYNRTNSILHGLCAWAVVASLFAFLVGNGITSLVRTTFNVAGTAAQTINQTAPDVTDQANDILKDITRGGGGGSAGQVTEQDIRNTAGDVRAGAASASWVAFISLALGAIFAMLGAAIGGKAVDRKLGMRGRLTGPRPAKT